MSKRFLPLLMIAALLWPFGGIAEETEPFMPGSRAAGIPNSYWETPMDITDEAAVWAMLTAPITVVRGHQMKQTVLYREPDEASEPVADVTMDSQGVHVLETRSDGWSLVEVYSSSFHDSKIRAWNQLTQGYIRTDMLQEKQVQQGIGLVVDKLTQRLYIFKDGRLYDTLAVSTGLPNERQPYNETRSGEFLLVSPVGQIVSDNLIGLKALRFNAGDMIHEVVHLKRGDKAVYEPYEAKLGQRASHGCIRVQRLRTPLGTNMSWLWKNVQRKMGTRIVIWEDLPGRQLPMPDSGLVLHYNTQGGKNYHAAPKCFGVRDKFLPMATFTYGELNDEPYSRLTPCPYCNPPLRVADIQAINDAHRLP